MSQREQLKIKQEDFTAPSNQEPGVQVGMAPEQEQNPTNMRVEGLARLVLDENLYSGQAQQGQQHPPPYIKLGQYKRKSRSVQQPPLAKHKGSLTASV